MNRRDMREQKLRRRTLVAPAVVCLVALVSPPHSAAQQDQANTPITRPVISEDVIPLQAIAPKRYFFPQANRDAIIVDERYNGGGYMADYYIDILRRPYASHWNTRYGNDLKTPIASIQGPKVMLIDENAGSGGDMLPWMFRKFGLGKLIGKRTWGGLVGTLGFPMLLDGGVISAPNFAIWVEDQGWIIENVGVPPDIEVEQYPADVIAGRDPQLERAIEEIMKELEANPPPKPTTPPYPVRVRR